MLLDFEMYTSVYNSVTLGIAVYVFVMQPSKSTLQSMLSTPRAIHNPFDFPFGQRRGSGGLGWRWASLYASLSLTSGKTSLRKFLEKRLHCS